MSERQRTQWIAYVVALFATGLPVVLHLTLVGILGSKGLFIIFPPAIILSAYMGGLRAGLLATGLSAFAADYFIASHSSMWTFPDNADSYALLLFILTGVVLSVLGEFWLRAQRRIVSLTADIAQLRFAEVELRRTTQLLQAIAEGTQDAVYVKDREGRHLMFNAAASRMVGKPIEEILGRDDYAIFNADDARVVMDHDRRVMESGMPDTDEKELTAGGVTRMYLASKAPYRDEHGNIIGIIGICHDITGRKYAEDMLRHANARLDLAVRGSNLAVWECDMPDGQIQNSHVTLINFWESLGYDSETEAADFPSLMMRTMHSDDQERVGREIQEFLVSDRRVFEIEVRARHKDGSDRWHLTRGVAIRDPNGMAVRFIGSSVDITDLKRAEEALRHANTRVELAVRSSNICIWECNMPDGRIENAQLNLINVWESLGYDDRAIPEDFSSAFAGYFHPADQERVGLELHALLNSDGWEWKNEYRVLAKDGSIRWLLARGTVLRDMEGKPVRFIGTSAEITDRKRAEEALRESEERFRQLAENVRGVFWLQEREWERLLYISPVYEEFWGRTCQSLYEQPRSWIDSVWTDDRDLVLAHFEQQSRGVSTETDFRITRPDGSIRWMRCRAFPLKNPGGEVYRVGGLLEDITERRQFEEELRRAKEAAEAANRAKDEFLANVSHEIRTPMNAILGMTDLALETPLGEEQRQYLTTVKSASESLLGIINDLLDFSKIEAGKLELDAGSFSLRAMVGDTMRAMAVRAHAKGLELIHHVQTEVSDALVGDAGRLRQILLNLVGNAIKFTDAGEVEVYVELATEVAGNFALDEVGLRFIVRDTGAGIPKDQQERIFKAFEQEDTSTTRRYGGTGLGLTISARLVALMEGSITVDSEPGRGSTFAFTARFGRSPQSEEEEQIHPPVLLRDLAVLIVDDNSTNRHILAGWLREWEMQPSVVGDAAAALEALHQASAAGRRYAIVLLDARMPDVGGMELARQIRQQSSLSATRIILLTSGEWPGDATRVRELKIDAQLLKPVQPDELLLSIYRIMNRTIDDPLSKVDLSLARESLPAQGSRIPPLRVLVAEDDEFNVELLEQLLGRRGHQVQIARNGRDAVTLAEGGYLDLLLLDVHMPELDGFQVVEAVREREQATGGHLPIICLTARSRKEDREQCLAAGMDDFLAKPIQAADLWAAIDRVVGGQIAAVRPGPGLLDPCVLLAACGGEAATLQNICKAFRAKMPDRLQAVQDAVQDLDAPRLREAAHKLSGMLSVLSTVAGRLASQLEDDAALGRLEEAVPMVSRLEAMVEELMKHANDLTLDALRGQIRDTT